MNRIMTLVAAALLLFSFFLPAASPAPAQMSAAEILEKARSQAREIEELKKVLNGPDQNLRLATFEAMVGSGDEAMRNTALELGLASADRLLQAMAFKAAIMGLDRLHLKMSVDTSAPESTQKAAASILERGSEFVLLMGYHDPSEGVFAYDERYKDTQHYRGQVNGTKLTFHYSNNSGSLELVGDDSVAGTLVRSGKQFRVEARFR